MMRDGLANRVLGGETVFLVRTMAKLRMDGVEDLLRSGRNARVRKSVVVVVHLGFALAYNAVF